MGTGPYRLVEYEVGVRAVLEKDPDHPWWGEGAYLDRIEFITTAPRARRISPPPRRAKST